MSYIHLFTNICTNILTNKYLDYPDISQLIRVSGTHISKLQGNALEDSPGYGRNFTKFLKKSAYWSHPIPYPQGSILEIAIKSQQNT